MPCCSHGCASGKSSSACCMTYCSSGGVTWVRRGDGWGQPINTDTETTSVINFTHGGLGSSASRSLTMIHCVRGRFLLICKFTDKAQRHVTFSNCSRCETKPGCEPIMKERKLRVGEETAGGAGRKRSRWTHEGKQK